MTEISTIGDQMKKIITLGLLLIVFTSCTTSNTNKKSITEKSAMVSSYYMKVDLPANASFTVKGISLLNTDREKQAMSNADQIIQESIVEAMRAKGFVYHSTSPSDLNIEYFLVVGDHISEADLNKRFQISAGIPNSASPVKYPKGTLFVDIIHANSGKLIWRGSAQAYANLKVSDSQRKERSYGILRTLLRSFE